MGHEHQQSSSSGAVVAIVVGVLLVAILGMVGAAGAWLLLVGTSHQESRTVAVAEANRAVAAELRAKGEAMHAVSQLQRATPQIQESSVVATPDPRLNFEVTIDREGNASIDGEGIDLDGLRARLTKLKVKTSNAFSVRINADPECPAKHVVSVLEVCEEVGDVDYRVASSNGTDIHMTATVASYEPAAEWDHFDDGTFSAYDKLTLKVVAPQRHAGAMFSVTVPPTELPENSAFRTAGSRFTLIMRESEIGATGLAWAAIEAAAIVQ